MIRRSAGRLPVLVIALVIAAGIAAGCGPSADRFVTSNARAHVNMLAETIGSRPTGSDAHRRAREYLIDQLRIAGMDVRVQDAEARRPELGLAGRVSNIVAVRQGTTHDAIALVAHYDSVPDGPGAGDDAFGAAVVVEAARVLGSVPMRHSLMVLITDSEENGLLGAAAAMTDPTIRDRIAAYLNVEASGASGPALLFESGPGNGWLTKTWAGHARFPRGGSFAIEIYKRLPNDTDFTVLKGADLTGLNFAIVGDSTAYHTDRDSAARLDDDSLTTAGENLVAIAAGLDAQDLRQRTSEQPTYFDIAGRWALSYGPLTTLVLGIVALVLGFAAWLRLAAAVRRTVGGSRLALTAVWALIGAVIVCTAMITAVWLLRATREVFHPWYAQVGRAAAFSVAAGIAAGWLATRAGALLPGHGESARHPALAWVVALPVWLVLTAASMWAAPAASYLATIPLLMAGVLLVALPPSSGTAVRLASAVVLLVTGGLWLQNTIDLLHFSNAVFGRFPMIAPVWVMPALLFLAGLFLVPPVIATVAAGSPGLARPSIFTGFCVLALMVTGLGAYFGDAYSDRHPLRRYARFVQDDGTKTAMWEIAGNEPGLDVHQTGELQWLRGADAPARPMPLAPLPFPFRFVSAAVPIETPAQVTASISRLTELVELTVSVRTNDPSARVTLTMPAGIEPVQSNLPGITNASGRWRSIYAAPPPEGLVWHVVVPADAESRLGEANITVDSARTPGAIDAGGPGPQLQPWMPTAVTAWHARAVYLIPIGPRLPAPMPMTVRSFE